jgi:predicted transglutaminase-like cysteine proteinase
MATYREQKLAAINEKIQNNVMLDNKQARYYYNTKYPKQDIVYNSRNIHGSDLKMRTDVRNFITPVNYLIRDLLKNELNIKITDKDQDAKAEKIQKWVVDNIAYVYDSQSQGFVEFWQFPFETLALRTGDCEDGAILMASMLLAAGIPAWRVRVAGGGVKVNNPTAPMGGHGWCCYLRKSDNKWLPLDWCYWPVIDKPIENRKTLREDDNYIETWFSWNHKYSWGRKSFVLEERLRK